MWYDAEGFMHRAEFLENLLMRRGRQIKTVGGGVIIVAVLFKLFYLPSLSLHVWDTKNTFLLLEARN